jgi:hypothetical protein
MTAACVPTQHSPCTASTFAWQRNAYPAHERVTLKFTILRTEVADSELSEETTGNTVHKVRQMGF